MRIKRALTLKPVCCLLAMFSLLNNVLSQDEMWDKTASNKKNVNLQWFKDAKFGMFIHWGLYSQLAGSWNNKRYYGSGEWLMSQAKIPAQEYARAANDFNPINFNADEWAQLAKDAGMRYLVITAKHHEGFSMYDSKVSDFSIVKSTPYRKDPMKALSSAVRKRGLQFGFYYSQFLDWHEPNGGGNKWDFDESKKDYLLYYKEKAIPQLKELLTNYGPLGIVWFDMPGGLTKEQTGQLVDSLRLLQPKTLFSSRVGQGLGDYKDFGDSEVPPEPINDAWESIYTHNDSWGYITHDMNFKTPEEIIKLLANVASKGGNLMLNVGPDGKGNIPYYSVKYLQETGKWLHKYGESIYGTTAGFIPAQPWGVTTAKPEKLFLHVLTPPRNKHLIVPDVRCKVTRVYTMKDNQNLVWNLKANDLVINLQGLENDNPDNVVVVEYTGKKPVYNAEAPISVSAQFPENNIDAIFAKPFGNVQIKSITSSKYYGDWKHATCVTGMKNIGDSISFQINIQDPGDYKIILEYACTSESAKQEGAITLAGNTYYFRTLHTGEYIKSEPLLFIKHTVAVCSITKPGIYSIVIHPVQQGQELFKLKNVISEAVN
ncbi:alpha-L-fucosidase [Chitinophagaceae bacterium LWZ2-11]